MYESQVGQSEITDYDIGSIEKQGELSSIFNDIEDNMIVQNQIPDKLPVYEEDYAGAYIDGDKLVVCTTDESDIESVGGELISANDDVTVKKVEYALNQLLDTMSYIEDELKEYNSGSNTKEYELLSSISGIAVNEKENLLEIGISELTDEKIDTFYSIFGEYDYVKFNEENAINVEYTETYKPGRAIYAVTNITDTTISYIRISIGYRAFWMNGSNTEYGFATCGHGIEDAINSYVYSDTSFSTTAGTIRTYQQSGSVDASFIKKNSGDSISLTAHYQDAYGSTGGDAYTMKANSYIMLPQVSLIFKVGSTSYFTSGTVSSRIYTSTFSDGTTLTNLYKTSCYADHGDSGGISFGFYYNEYYSAGLVTGVGSLFDGAIFLYSVMTKADEVIDALNIYPY